MRIQMSKYIFLNGQFVKCCYKTSLRTYSIYKYSPQLHKTKTHNSLCRLYHTLLTSAGASNISQCLHKLEESFKNAGISEPDCSAEYIVAHAIRKQTLHGVSKKQMLSSSQMTRILQYADQRMCRLPIQYILEEWEFKHLTIKCRPPVFIPRPETEELIGFALKDPIVQSASHMLEVGPGTGAISLALLTEIPRLQATAIEISEEACDLSEQNARNANVYDRFTIINADFTAKSSLGDIGLEKRADFLISNPPYIPTPDMENLQQEVKLFEDHRALDGGKDGLDIVKYILKVATLLVKSDGSIWLEVDSSHPSLIKDMVHQNPAYNLLYNRTYHDFCNSTQTSWAAITVTENGAPLTPNVLMIQPLDQCYTQRQIQNDEQLKPILTSQS